MIEADDFEDSLEAGFEVLAHVVNRHLMDHMRRVCGELDLDLESAFIWGTLANFNVSAAFAPGIDPRELRENEPTMKPARLADLVQISGLPRETVRRKLEKLRQRGKVVRDSEGRWIILRSGVDDQVRSFTKETVRRHLSVAQELLGILKRSRS